MISCVCGAQVEASRLPPGWKRHQGRAWCRTCWHAAYRLRAVTLPIARSEGRTWAELRAALEICWEQTTSLANFELQELAKTDVIRLPDDEKLVRMPARPTKGVRSPYQRAREIVPDLDTRSVTSVLRAVQQRYMRRRYEVVWLRAAAPPHYRYPMPYPVHNQAWKVSYGANHKVLVDVPLVGGQRWTLRLKSGPEFGRQLAAVRLLTLGAALQGELALYRQTKQGRPPIYMCKMVMWLPRRLKGEEPAWLGKHRRRLDSLTHQISAQLVGYARRRKIARVELDLSEQGYVESFPWSVFETRLAYKLDDAGIELVSSGEGGAQEAGGAR